MSWAQPSSSCDNSHYNSPLHSLKIKINKVTTGSSIRQSIHRLHSLHQDARRKPAHHSQRTLCGSLGKFEKRGRVDLQHAHAKLFFLFCTLTIVPGDHYHFKGLTPARPANKAAPGERQQRPLLGSTNQPSHDSPVLVDGPIPPHWHRENSALGARTEVKWGMKTLKRCLSIEVIMIHVNVPKHQAPGNELCCSTRYCNR